MMDRKGQVEDMSRKSRQQWTPKYSYPSEHPTIPVKNESPSFFLMGGRHSFRDYAGPI